MSPSKIRPQEKNFRTKSPTKKMGHSKTSSMVNRLYAGNSKVSSPPRKAKKEEEKTKSNEKVLKYLEDSLAVFESKV